MLGSVELTGQGVKPYSITLNLNLPPLAHPPILVRGQESPAEQEGEGGV